MFFGSRVDFTRSANEGYVELEGAWVLGFTGSEQDLSEDLEREAGQGLGDMLVSSSVWQSVDSKILWNMPEHTYPWPPSYSSLL